MKTIRKPLYMLKSDDKFLHQGTVYTIYQFEGNMAEVFRNNEFSAWPTWNGKGPTYVSHIIE
jgi:hypothetical protein